MKKLISFGFVLFFTLGISVAYSQGSVPMEKIKQSAFEPDTIVTGIADTILSVPGNLKRMPRKASEGQSESSPTFPGTESVPQNESSSAPVDRIMKKSKDE